MDSQEERYWQYQPDRQPLPEEELSFEPTEIDSLSLSSADDLGMVTLPCESQDIVVAHSSQDHPEDHLEGPQDHPEDHPEGPQDHPEDHPEGPQDHPEDHPEGPPQDHPEDHLEGPQDHPEDHPEGPPQDHPEDHLEGPPQDHPEDHESEGVASADVALTAENLKPYNAEETVEAYNEDEWETMSRGSSADGELERFNASLERVSKMDDRDFEKAYKAMKAHECWPLFFKQQVVPNKDTITDKEQLLAFWLNAKVHYQSIAQVRADAQERHRLCEAQKAAAAEEAAATKVEEQPDEEPPFVPLRHAQQAALRSEKRQENKEKTKKKHKGAQAKPKAKGKSKSSKKVIANQSASEVPVDQASEMAVDGSPRGSRKRSIQLVEDEEKAAVKKTHGFLTYLCIFL